MESQKVQKKKNLFDFTSIKIIQDHYNF
ncbi:uncharacterized protein METZ01_LOCUS114723 [marine metagenome]|uniref:Uncharacterized protein n=1 Tax=marine metagenome TaxID=408172 RepID=A0A381XAT8_9ZZZZ